MKFQEIQKLSVADMEKKISELQLELVKQRAQVAAGTGAKNPGNIKKARKTIARIKTAMTAKQAQQGEAQ